MSDPQNPTGFGGSNVPGSDEDTVSATFGVDRAGLHVYGGAITVEGPDGQLQVIDGTSENDWVNYGVYNGSFAKGPPDPLMNITPGIGQYERTITQSSNLVGYWRLGETSGTTAHDVVNGRDGTYTGGVTLGVDGALQTGENIDGGGLRDKAADFDGTDDYVNIPTATALHPGDTFSLELWFKRGATMGTTQALISTGANDYEVILNSSDKLQLVKKSGSAIWTTDATFTDTAWHHAIITKATTTTTIYVDGVESPGTGSDQTIVASATDITLGRRQAGTAWFDGSLDEFAIWSGALMPGQAADHYQVSRRATVNKEIAGSNFMPNWRFVQSSNLNITAKQVTDASSPSGSNFRMTFVSGQTDDEAFFEQIIDMGGARARWTGDYVRGTVLALASNSGSFAVSQRLQYLDAARSTIGMPDETNVSVASPLTAGTEVSFNGTDLGVSPPATARYLRMRHVVRRPGVGTVVGSIDFTDIRRDFAKRSILVAEASSPGSFGPGEILQVEGVIWAQSAGTYRTSIAAPVAYFCADINLPASGAQNILPVTANVSGTPISGASRVVLPFDGTVIGIGVRLSTARTTGSCTFRASANGVAIGPTATIDGTDTQTAFMSGTLDAAGSTFSAGQLLMVEATGSGTFAPTTADVLVTVVCALEVF